MPSESLQIRDFSLSDLNAAGEIAYEIWHEELAGVPEAAVYQIFQYLVRYYYVPDSPYRVAATEDGKLCGFLLAAPSDLLEDDFAEHWLAKNMTVENAKWLRDYRGYLNGNRCKEKSYARPEDVVLQLFCSRRPGAGRVLLEEFENRCRMLGGASMLLWTDETCNYAYYPAHHFTEVASYITDPPLNGQRFRTMLFRKSIAARKE